MTHHSVKDVHDLHSWSLDGSYNILTLHVVLRSEVKTENLSDIKKELKSILADNEIHHVTLEFEAENEPCELEDC